MEDIITSLKFIAKKLVHTNIEWYLIGKTNLSLQGVNIQPSKIGILIHNEDLNKFLSIFGIYKTSRIKLLENGEAKEFLLNIQNTKVEVCAEYKHGTYWKIKKDIVSITLDNLIIKGFSLPSELTAYELLGDYETSNIIKQSLSQGRRFKYKD